MQKHNKDAADEHLQMITMYTASMDLQSMEMRRELQVYRGFDNMKYKQKEKRNFLSYK